MTAFQATVIFPGKDWDNEHGKKTQAKFLPLGLEDKKENQINVNSSDVESNKAKLLKSLKKKQVVWLVLSGYFQGDREKPFYDVLYFKDQGLEPNGSSGGGGENPSSKSAINVDERILKHRVETYYQAFASLSSKFEEANIDIPVDQLSMMASSIAKQL